MISFRTSNIIAILIAVLAFYGSLTGLTPQNLVDYLTNASTRASQDAAEWVEETLPSPLASPSAPSPSPPSTRLKRHTRKSPGENR
jgi:hypothetical protein